MAADKERSAVTSTDRARGLAPEAYMEVPGGDYPPYVPADVSIAEFTLKAALLGAFFGILFGAANAYLGLLVGLTISTSIPVAVLTVAAAMRLRNRPDLGSYVLAGLAAGAALAALQSALAALFPLALANLAVTALLVAFDVIKG